MRIERLAVIGLLGIGCGYRLDATPPAAPDGGPPPPLASCAPLAGVADLVTGRLVWATLPDQRGLVIAGGATIAGQDDSRAFVVTEPDLAAAFADCLRSATPLPNRPAVDLSGLAPGDRAQPLASVALASDTYLYFSALHADGLASDGFGVARWDAAAAQFRDPVLLWTADRPSYGSGAVFDGTSVYVFGGLNDGYLSAEMFLARVAPDQVAVPAAYAYWRGGGAWDPDPDAAAPFAGGGAAPTVAWDAARNRWLVAYVDPLATEISLRSGLGPGGPWSMPVSLGSCALPAQDPGALCGDVVLYPSSPAANPGGPELLLAQGVVTFSRPPGVPDSTYTTRLVQAPWPAALP